MIRLWLLGLGLARVGESSTSNFELNDYRKVALAMSGVLIISRCKLIRLLFCQKRLHLVLSKVNIRAVQRYRRRSSLS